MVVPVDVFAGEADDLLACTFLPMPGDAWTRAFMRLKNPSAAGVVAGCIPSRPWTGCILMLLYIVKGFGVLGWLVRGGDGLDPECGASFEFG